MTAGVTGDGSGPLAGVGEASALTSDERGRLREAVEENARCAGTRFSEKYDAEARHYHDAGPYCGGCRYRMDELAESVPALLAQIEGLEALVVDLTARLDKVERIGGS